MIEFHRMRASRLFTVCFALAVSLCLLNVAEGAAQTAHAIITVPASAKAPADLKQKLQAWRKAGQIKKILWLDRLQKEDPAFASLISLEFESEAAYQKWLGQAKQAIAPATVKAVDVLTAHDSGRHDAANSVFKVNVYRMKVSTARYREFAEGYIAPLMSGQVDGGFMTDYVMYAERGNPGEARAYLIVEYRNPPAFVDVVPYKANLRKELTARHPTYPKFDPIKDTLRDDVSESLAAWRALD